MAVEFEWIWGPMIVETVNGVNDVVTGIEWIAYARDNVINPDVAAKDSGRFTVPDVDSDNFIVLSSLTKANVDSWISVFDKSPIEDKLKVVLETLNNPPVKILPIPE